MSLRKNDWMKIVLWKHAELQCYYKLKLNSLFEF